MDQHQRSMRLGATVIAFAVLLRLFSAGYLDTVARFLAQPKIASFLTYLETGRIVRFSASEGFSLTFFPESPAPVFAGTTEELPLFGAEDARNVQVKYSCSLRPDLEALMCRSLDWELEDEEPTVLILHTHATESYTRSPGETYAESAAFRTLDEDYNLVSVGQRLAQVLEAGGVHVIHDRTLHDYPSYNGSYDDARTTTQAYLAQYPSIRLVLDLHRDASGDLNNQMKTHALVDGNSAAQLMLVLGSDGAGLAHENWQENLALGLKLYTQLERIAPGICRPVDLRPYRFNMDLSEGALLVEVGAAGNSRQEALAAVEVLGQGILALKHGAQTE